MILADTSVWIDHFREGSVLHQHLTARQIVIHPMVLGELAVGPLPGRQRTIDALARLPRIAQAPDEVVLQAIEMNRWFNKGLGWVDAHLLAAALKSRIPLWTRDLRLHRLAQTHGIAQ